MLFAATWKEVLKGEKTQSRYPIGSGDVAGFDDPAAPDQITQISRTNREGVKRPLFILGQSYSVQPGRGKKTIGRIRVSWLRRQQLQEISADEARLEFPEAWPPGSEIAAAQVIDNFSVLWDKAHPQEGAKWQDNPDVWVVEFELVSKSVTHL